jgi:DUF1680 family protein
MKLTRRRFLQSSALAGVEMAGRSAKEEVHTASSLGASAAASGAHPEEVVSAPDADWMSNTPATLYRAYRSRPAKSVDAATWVQIDLGATQKIDLIKVYPANEKGKPGFDAHWAGEAFPVRFKIEVANEAAFHDPKLIMDHTAADLPNPEGRIQKYEAAGAPGRYIRFTATRLTDLGRRGIYMALGKIEVYSRSEEIATLRPVTVDADYGTDGDAAQITRPARPGGELTYVDNSANVTAPGTWKPPAPKARVTLGGVTLQGGVFQTAMENNIRYLLDSFSEDELLRQFRDRAGIANPPDLPKPKTKFWEADLAGSNAGRFLMGAGNTLRWIDHPELRRRLDAIVDGIAQCRQPNGYIMAYPEGTIFFSERGAYTRAWLVHGLIEAGYAGNPKAFELLRGYHDWFNQCPYLPQLMRFAVQGGQGMIANTRMYFTPVGKPADIQVIQRYFQENFWVEQLAAREERAVWQYPYDRPHCYLLTNLEAYMDLYRATGDPRYLHGVEGGWDLYHHKWENVGGSISIIEFVESPPESYSLNKELEELCGNAFWTFLSQRLYMLDPEKEKYVTEIEKSIYNVAMANQAGSEGLRYHALLAHHKEKPTQINTCCEGQGTRLIASIPEHIYALADDGLYVNLFEPSTIEWKVRGETLRLKMETQFPFDPEVRLQVSAPKPARANIRVRVPSWSNSLTLYLNGARGSTGKPGSYLPLDRTWSEGDKVHFRLEVPLRVERYAGVDQIPDHERYAVSYGPILLAAIGAPEIRLRLKPLKQPQDLLAYLQPIAGQPLHYTVQGNPGIEFMPYWQVDKEAFNCFPAAPARIS